MAAPLTKDLRKKYGIRNIEVKKGDEVKITRGKFKKKTGKVGQSDLTRTRISVEGIERTKKDGNKVAVWFAPSKVMIISLDLEDRKRLKRIKKTEAKEEKKTKTTKLTDKQAKSKDSATSQEKKNVPKEK